MGIHDSQPKVKLSVKELKNHSKTDTIQHNKGTVSSGQVLCHFDETDGMASYWDLSWIKTDAKTLYS